MKEAPDGRKIFLWRGPEATNRLTDAIAEAAIAELFNVNGVLVWLNEGQPVPVNKGVLREVITRHIVSVRLVDRESSWKVEYFSFAFSITADVSKEPNERVLIDMAAALLGQVAKGPQEPVRLTSQQQKEVRYRIGIGEPQANLAREYKVDADTIRQLVAQ